jgi:hypothetical protein
MFGLASFRILAIYTLSFILIKTKSTRTPMAATTATSCMRTDILAPQGATPGKILIGAAATATAAWAAMAALAATAGMAAQVAGAVAADHILETDTGWTGATVVAAAEAQEEKDWKPEEAATEAAKAAKEAAAWGLGG